MLPSFLYKVEGPVTEENKRLLTGREAILRTLAYFDIFHYPLTCDEIREYLQNKLPENVFLECLRQLLEEGKIYFFDNVYSLHNNPLLQHKRKQGNQRAERLLAKAKRTGRFLYQFPFVTAIGISGSLSKNYADEKADFDFFIITKPNRLWIARTFMHLFKKMTYLVGRQHHYCMNYYIDETAFQLEDQNIFTATELKTLLPVAGEDTLRDFFVSNDWVEQYLPACKFRKAEKSGPRNGYLKRFFEKLTGFHFLDNYFYRLTSSRWQRKEQKGLKNKKGVKMGLLSGKHFAKADPGGFQNAVLDLYAEKTATFKAQVSTFNE